LGFTIFKQVAKERFRISPGIIRMSAAPDPLAEHFQQNIKENDHAYNLGIEE
jgi:hypothetical protein